MAARKQSEGQQTDESHFGEVSFSVEPGTKVQITVEAGENIVEGKVPITVRVEQVVEEPNQVEEISQPKRKSVRLPRIQAGKLRDGFEALQSRVRKFDLATWLFILALSVYLVTRLVGLTKFPIYFFTDEAIQSQSISDLINNDYRDPSGVLLPTYFRNGEYYNLSTSVYLQWLPYILFGKSAVATRATSVIVTLLAAFSVGIILRDILKLKYWWAGTLFISITPAWFLHSRTAFETVEFVAFYASTLCAYLFYRYKSTRFLYLVVFLGALSFYTYSPAQAIVPLTAISLLISDWRYHWENRRTVLIGMALALVLALPYIRASFNNPNAPFAHLHTLWSYWFEKIPLSEKIIRYLSEFGIGLSPWYWYVPNERDLSRHLMKGYGNIMIATFPFAVLGFAHALRCLRRPSYRTILIALLISPAAAALVQVSITRAMVFVVPAAILTAIGLEQILDWIGDPKKRLSEIIAGPSLSASRGITALLILLAGLFLAFISEKTINRIAIMSLAVILSMNISGVLKQHAQSFTERNIDSSKLKLWIIPQSFLALSAFVVMSGANLLILNDALRNGPLWFRDYGLGGMQYGAFQIFDIMEDYLNEHPDMKIIFSPDWANGADVVARFFLSDPSSIQIGSVRGHITQKLPLDDQTLFIMTPQEYDLVSESNKLTDIQTETIIPYPDGNPGFYFVHLRYVDNIDEIFASEIASRQALQESTVSMDGQIVNLRYSYLDSDDQAESIALVFDNDPYTVAKTFESNPFRLEMTFPSPRTLNGFSIIIGSAYIRITLKCYLEPGVQSIDYVFEGQGTKNQPELSFDLPEPTSARVMQWEVLDPHSLENVKIHIWELKLR